MSRDNTPIILPTIEYATENELWESDKIYYGSYENNIPDYTKINRLLLPYEFTFVEIRDWGVPSRTCYNCGTAIRYEYIIETKNGKQFPVGSECVRNLLKEKKEVRKFVYAKYLVDYQNKAIKSIKNAVKNNKKILVDERGCHILGWKYYSFHHCEILKNYCLAIPMSRKRRNG